MRDPITDLRRYAEDLQAEIPVERARYRVARVIHQPTSGPRWSRRTVVAAATSVLMGLSNVALAAIANPSAPGDALYGVDRAYERVVDLFGMPGDHHVERLDEATVLLDRGRAVEALELVQEALKDIADAGDLEDARAELEELNAGNRIDQIELGSAVKALVEAAKSIARHVDEAGISDAATHLGEPRDLADAVEALRAVVRPDHVDGGPGPPGRVGPPEGGGPADGSKPPGLENKQPKSPGPPTSLSSSGGSITPGSPPVVDPPVPAAEDDQGDDDQGDGGQGDGGQSDGGQGDDGQGDDGQGDDDQGDDDQGDDGQGDDGQGDDGQGDDGQGDDGQGDD